MGEIGAGRKGGVLREIEKDSLSTRPLPCLTCTASPHDERGGRAVSGEEAEKKNKETGAGRKKLS